MNVVVSGEVVLYGFKERGERPHTLENSEGVVFYIHQRGVVSRYANGDEETCYWCDVVAVFFGPADLEHPEVVGVL